MAIDPTTDRLITPVLDGLRGDMAVQLEAANRGVCRFPLVVGDARPPAEGCDCTCAAGQGMAWVRLVAANPHAGTPVIPAPCAAGRWTLTVELGIYRCDQTALDEDGTPPTEQAVTDQAAALAVDGAVLRRTLRCKGFLDTWHLEWSADALTPIGPSGGCVGMALTCWIQREECGCPE